MVTPSARRGSADSLSSDDVTVARAYRVACTRSDNQSLGDMRNKTYRLDQGVYVWDRHHGVILVGTVVFTNPPIHEDYLVFRNHGRLNIANKKNVYTNQRKAIARARAEVKDWEEKFIY